MAEGPPVRPGGPPTGDPLPPTRPGGAPSGPSEPSEPDPQEEPDGEGVFQGLGQYTEGAHGRPLEFDHETVVDSETGREKTVIKGRVEGRKFVARKVLPSRAPSEEMVHIVGADLKRMLDLAEEYAQIGGFGPLLPEVEENEEESTG